jgi:RimJ/RimL family protein N-acetyltransferase
VMAYGRTVLGLNRIVAITSTANHRSVRLLEKLGLRFEKMIKLSDTGEEVELFTPHV